MALKKGDRLNPNGRPVGAKNKANNDLKLWVKNLLESNTEQIEADLKTLDSDKRLQILISLMKYAIPTLSSISVENQLELEYKHLEKMLQATPTEYIDKISEKILSLKSMKNEQD